MSAATILSGLSCMPGLPTDHLARPRLSEALLRSEARVRLLWAPAGSGKTVLLRECMEYCPAETRLCWLDLQGRGIGAEQFLDLLAERLGLRDSASLPGRLAGWDAPLWLVLDDLPRHADAAFDAMLNQLLLQSSPKVHWWLGSRRRAGLQLERLLLMGALHEVDFSQLTMRVDELGTFVPNSPPEALLTQTGGWFAAVRLLVARSGQGEYYLLQSYLDQELLAYLPESLREGFCALACLPSFDAALCEQLTGVADGRQQMLQLYENSAFVEVLAQGVQRIYPVVARMLQERVPVRLRKTFHLRASQWLLAQERVAEAIDYALLGEQPETAASLIERLTLDWLLCGRHLAQMLRWRQQLPSELRDCSPRLMTLGAWALLLAGRLDELQGCLEQLQRFLPAPACAEMEVLQEQWRILSLSLDACQGSGDACLDVQCADWPVTAMAWLMQGDTFLASGRMSAAQELNRRALKLAREQGSRVFEGLFLLQHMQMLETRGELVRAEALGRRVAAELADEPGLLRGRAHLALARLLARLGRCVEADGHFRLGLHESGEVGDPYSLYGHLGLADLHAATGDFPTAFSHLSEAERDMQLGQVAEVLYRPQICLLRGRIWLCQGQSERVRRLVEQCLGRYPRNVAGGAPETQPSLYLLRLRTLSASGLDMAEELEQASAQALEERRVALACEAWFALAECHAARARQRKASSALLDGMALSRRMAMLEVEWHCRPVEPSLLALTQRAAGQGGDDCGVTSAQLSRRELSVLQMIAQGLPNQDIADQMHISLHTVKSHAQKINIKLGVSRRVQAVVRAKELGLVH